MIIADNGFIFYANQCRSMWSDFYYRSECWWMKIQFWISSKLNYMYDLTLTCIDWYWELIYHLTVQEKTKGRWWYTCMLTSSTGRWESILELHNIKYLHLYWWQNALHQHFCQAIAIPLAGSWYLFDRCLVPAGQMVDNHFASNYINPVKHDKAFVHICLNIT